MKPIINVDVDGVLYDFTGAMKMELIAITGRAPNSLPAPDQWDLTAAWDIPVPQFDSIMFDSIAAGRLFRRGRLIHPADARSSLQRLIDADWHVRLVSSKTFKEDRFITYMARKNMIDWIYETDIPHHTISFSDGLGKLSYRADAIVDDKPTTAWAQWGADNFLFAQPWNIRHGGQDGNVEVNRVGSLREVADLLLGEPA